MGDYYLDPIDSPTRKTFSNAEQEEDDTYETPADLERKRIYSNTDEYEEEEQTYLASVDSPTKKEVFQLEEPGAFIAKDSGKPKKRRTIASKFKTSIPKDVLRKRLKKKLMWIGITMLIIVLVIAIIILATRKTAKQESDEKDINFAISFFNHSTSTGIVTSKKIKEFDLHSNFTLCFWMKVEEEPTLETDLVNVFNFKTFKSEMLLELDKNRLIKFAFDDKVFSFPRSNIDVWEPLCLSKEHLMLNVFTRSQNGTIDSIVIGILGPLSPRKLQQMVIIGYSETPGIDVRTGEFKGSIAHLFLYSKALNVNQVAAFFDKNPPMDNVGFGWWDFKNQALPGYSEEIKPFSRD